MQGIKSFNLEMLHASEQSSKNNELKVVIAQRSKSNMAMASTKKVYRKHVKNSAKEVKFPHLLPNIVNIDNQ